jgi:hypothetical protein
MEGNKRDNDEGISCQGYATHQQIATDRSASGGDTVTYSYGAGFMFC